MELMERIALLPHGGYAVGTAMAIVVAFAVFVLGAPPLILLPVGLIGATAYSELRRRALRNIDR